MNGMVVWQDGDAVEVFQDLLVPHDVERKAPKLRQNRERERERALKSTGASGAMLAMGLCLYHWRQQADRSIYVPLMVRCAFIHCS